MSPYDIEIIKLKAEIDRLEGKSARVAQEVIDLLGVALKGLRNKSPEVVFERIDVSIELLMQLIG